MSLETGVSLCASVDGIESACCGLGLSSALWVRGPLTA